MFKHTQTIRRIVRVCFTILWGRRLKGYDQGYQSQLSNILDMTKSVNK